MLKVLNAFLLLFLSSTYAASLHAQVSTNLGVASNYVWRGVSYSDDGPALQGGIDWSNDHGVYVGSWLSTTDDGVESDVEYDLYLGLEKELGAVSIDLGVARYDYIDLEDADVTELYLGAEWEMASLYHAIDGDNDTNYTMFAYEISIEEYALTVFYGSWGDTADGNHFGLHISRSFEWFDMDLSLEQSDEDLDDDTLLYVLISRYWDL